MLSPLGSHPSQKAMAAVISQWISTGPILVTKSTVRPWRTNKFSQNLNPLSQTWQKLLVPDHQLNYLPLGIKADHRKFQTFCLKSLDWIIWRINFLRVDSSMCSSSPLHERDWKIQSFLVLTFSRTPWKTQSSQALLHTWLWDQCRRLEEHGCTSTASPCKLKSPAKLYLILRSGKQIKNHRERTISAVTSEWKLCGMSLVHGKKVVDFLYKLILT